jgi:hypothetical protein
MQYFIRMILNSNRTEMKKMQLGILPHNQSSNEGNYFMSRREGSLVRGQVIHSATQVKTMLEKVG